VECVICGEREAKSRDHVPPKGIFCRPRPGNLVRVPACSQCNNRASDLDERFRVYLGMHVTSNDEAGARFYREEALRTLRHNRALREEILSKAEPTYLATESGVIHGWAFRIAWDSAAHDAIVERTIRGLYYHHFGEVLGSGVSVKVQWLLELTPEMIARSEEWAANTLGTGECVYRFGRLPKKEALERAEDSPLHSVWIFQFYKAHWASGHTTPVRQEA
jgi:hypothetical protein